MRAWLLMLAVAGGGDAVAQGVYKWTDANGVTHYGDRPPATADAESVAIDPAPAIDAAAASRIDALEASTAEANRARGEATAAPNLSIIMYSTPTCGYCKRARSYFAQRGVPYREYDVSGPSAARDEWKRLGGVGVPLFVINGRVSSGFTAESMSRKLAALGVR